MSAEQRLDANSEAPSGLLFVSDDAPGIKRVRRGDKFTYRLPNGSALRDEVQLLRIRKLAIPPAYTDVWICSRPNGHLQATGRDARGRKQYRYHAEWRRARDADKFERMREFGQALPKVRARVARDLAQAVGRQPSRTAVLATLVRLLDTTLVRVGNDEYARSNGSFGLTTLRNRHASIKGDQLKLRFKGKSGVLHDVSVEDPRVARIVRRCQAMPGQDLFQYQGEDGQIHGVGSADVNAYLREASGAEFTAKDFRTWHATALALALVATLDEDGRLKIAGGGDPAFEGGLGASASSAGTRNPANLILASVARRLGNTPAVCRKSYVHPGVMDLAVMDAGQRTSFHASGRAGAGQRGLSADERALMAFLKPRRAAR